jgi:hypothetical protein
LLYGCMYCWSMHGLHVKLHLATILFRARDDDSRLFLLLPLLPLLPRPSCCCPRKVEKGFLNSL